MGQEALPPGQVQGEAPPPGAASSSSAPPPPECGSAPPPPECGSAPPPPECGSAPLVATAPSAASAPPLSSSEQPPPAYCQPQPHQVQPAYSAQPTGGGVTYVSPVGLSAAQPTGGGVTYINPVGSSALTAPPRQPSTWYSGMLGCFDDVGLCCDVCWCWACNFARVLSASRGVPDHCDCGDCCIATCLCHFLGPFTAIGWCANCWWSISIRQNVVQKFMLPSESWPLSVLYVCCCFTCNICQLHKQLAYEGVPPGSCCCPARTIVSKNNMLAAQQMDVQPAVQQR